MRPRYMALLAFAALTLSACITTSMQGYADRELPQHPVQRIAILVSAPTNLAVSLQSNIAGQAKERGLFAEDVLLILPPTRTYNNTEIKSTLAKDGIDAVLVLNVGDSGVRKEYAGTYFYGGYSGTSNATGTATSFGNVTNISVNGTSSGTMSATAVPTYRYSRQSAFQARLLDASTGRTLWVGNGQVQAGGLLFVGDGASAGSAASAIFDDMHNKGIIGSAAS
jgi:hypothetical protein